MKHSWRVCALLVPLGLGAACVQGSTYDGLNSGGSGGVVGAGAGSGCGARCHPVTVAAAASGTSGSSAGTTTGGSGTGSTTGSVSLPTFDCASLTATDGGACPGGMVQLSGTVLTLGQGAGDAVVQQLLPGVSVGALGCSQTAAISDDDGGFVLCLPSDTAISTSFSDSSYLSANMAELNASANVQYGGVVVISQLIDQFVIGMSAMGLNQDAGAVLGVVHSLSGTGACAPVYIDNGMDAGIPDYSGWTFTATNLDGSAGPWTIGYLGNMGIDSSAMSTGPGGLALIYNISTDIAEIKVSASPPTALAAQCALQNTALGFTGKVYAIPGQFGYFPALIP